MITYSDNLKSWQQTFNTYANFCQKDFAAIANKKAIDLAIKCYQQTQVASRDVIRNIWLKGRQWYGQVVKDLINSGKIARKVGKKGGIEDWRQYVGRASRRLIARRIRAVGYVRVGWLAAAERIREAMRGEDLRNIPKTSFRIFSAPLGNGQPARDGFNPFAMVSNQSAERARHGDQTVYRILERGAAKALRESDLDMQRYIERKLRERIRQFTGI